MRAELANIKLFFPKKPCVAKNKREFVEVIMSTLKKDGSIEYAGYLKGKDLYAELVRYLGKKIDAYEPITAQQKQSLEKTIHATVKKCHKLLPHPDAPIFVFVYPWFPKADDAVSFGGVTAFAAYRTIHLFIATHSYTEASLAQTVAHEWNHLLFYAYHPEQRYTLHARMVMEGYAEVFREELVGGKPAPWALALTKEEARRQYSTLKQKLSSKSVRLYRDIFFGNSTYKRWTGYAIGYRLVKELRKRQRDLSWKNSMKTKSEDIAKIFTKKGAQ